jgi:hypothetical protein
MHEWAMRISEFVLGHGPKPTAKFQQYIALEKCTIEKNIFVIEMSRKWKII